MGRVSLAVSLTSIELLLARRARGRLGRLRQGRGRGRGSVLGHCRRWGSRINETASKQ